VSVRWYQFVLLGLTVSIPFVVWMSWKKRDSEAQKALESYRPMLKGCSMCDKLFPKHLVRMIIHLQDVHGISEDDSICMVDDLARQFRTLKYKKWETK